jgi:hypothetical protein
MQVRYLTRREALACGVAAVAEGLALSGCRRPETVPTSPAVHMAAPAQTMPQILEQLARTADPRYSDFLNAERAEMIRTHLEHPANRNELLMLAPRLPLELLNAGKTREAIHEYDQIEQRLNRVDPGFMKRPANRRGLLLHRALAYLRLGEQENCCAEHNADSCLAPLRGGGIHRHTEGSRRASELLLQMLREFPEDRTAQWLLNIALMTLGEYPQRVPSRWLIPPSAFASDAAFPRFPDVADRFGLSFNALSGSVIWDDFDNDGFLDLMVSSFGLRDQLRYFHNNGDGTFTDRTEAAGLLGEVSGLNMISGDYNNDGNLDVVVLRGGWLGKGGHHPLSLLRNNGNGTFTDVTQEAGLLRFHPTQTAVFFDYNNDGFLDLFVGNETSGDDEIHPCELFRNNGDGTFTEVAELCGVNIKQFVKAVACSDFNNDGRPDLFLSLRDRTGILLRNDGPAGPDTSPKAPWKFTDVTAEAGITGPTASFAAFFFDYDNDGWPDLFIAGYNLSDVGDVASDYLHLPHTGQRSKLYRNNRRGGFTDVTKEAGLDRLLLAMASNYGDLDNDGNLDFYLGTGVPNLIGLMPNRMFRNAGNGRFQDVTTAGGFGNLQKGHGIAFADINNDGLQEVYEKMGGAYEGDTAHSVLFANPGNTNHWVTLKLEGVKTNRSAIGARIKVTVNTPAGTREIHRTVGAGANFGCNPLRAEIGLGQALSIARVDVFWPVTGRTQTWNGLEMDRFYRLHEDEAQAESLPLRSFKILQKT